jgi:hypothetical protein
MLSWKKEKKDALDARRGRKADLLFEGGWKTRSVAAMKLV